MRHNGPKIMSISHVHVLLWSSAISLIVSLTLPSWSPVLVLKLPNAPIVTHTRIDSIALPEDWYLVLTSRLGDRAVSESGWTRVHPHPSPHRWPVRWLRWISATNLEWTA